ncbi:MAG: (Fe-S)-binding protein [Nocardioidaceae bacterium]
MPRNSERSFCCGAGGARMWMEEKIGERINVNRTIEAVATGADQIAVGCPFCRVMLSDGLTLQQAEGQAREEVEVLDVAQMLLASLRRDADADAAIAAAEPDEADAADPHSITEHEQVGPPPRQPRPAARTPRVRPRAAQTPLRHTTSPSTIAVQRSTSHPTIHRPTPSRPAADAAARR